MSFLGKEKQPAKSGSTYVTSEGKGRKITSVCFPIDTFEELKQEADSIGITVSSLVLNLVEGYLEHKKELNNDVN